MVNYVSCECGNLVETLKRHDFSVLPCSKCKEKIEVVQ